MNILEEIQNCYVEWKELGTVVDTVTSPTKLTKKEYQVTGKIPIVDQGEQFIAGYADNEKYLEKDEYIIFGDHSEHVKYVDFAFIQGADGLKILKPKSGIKAKYLYYCFCNFYKREGSYKRHWSKAKTTLIPIPRSEEIQEKIVQTLDKFTDYVTELTSELTSRKEQYSFYRDKLLSFEDEVYQVEWKTLSEIAKDFGRGKSQHRPRNDVRLYGGDIPFIQTGDIREAGKWIENYSQTYSAFGLQQSKQWEKGTLCITIAANIAETGLLGFDACFPDSIIGFVANPKFAITEYVYYYLNSIKDYLANKSYGSAQDNLNLSTFSSLKIPVPSLEIQSRIVQVLDNFDKVCNDLNIGLPKEIELRQKQYEYFREKLLTFVAEGEYTDSTVQTRHH